MTATIYSQRFAAALDAVDPHESIDRVKNAVIDELHELDPRVHLTKTAYFNHTYAPDLVASWNDGNGRSERFIYIRSDTRISYLLEDIQFVHENKPIVFGLSLDGWADDQRGINELAERSRDADTLVTDTSGVADLIEKRSSSAFLKLVSSSLTKGGRGLVDQVRARYASQALEGGFNGALGLQREPTENAIHVANPYFIEEYSKKVEQLLQAAWIGAGGGITDFPGDPELSASISDDALQFLLTYDEIDNPSFWRRVGRKLSLSQIGRLDLGEGSSNLDHLMKYNIDTFWARCARVLMEEPSTDIKTYEHNWFTRSRLVGIQQPRFSALFADRVDEFEKSATESDGIEVSELRSRATDATVSQVDLVAIGRQVRYSASEGESVFDDDDLDSIADTLGDDTLVYRAEVELNDSRYVSCNFSTLTAAGRTSSKLPLSQLAQACLPLLVDLTDDERSRLNEVFSKDEDS